MFLRCLLAAADEETAGRLERLLRRSPLHIRKIRRPAEVWSQTKRGGLDLVLVAEDLLGPRCQEYLETTFANPLAPEVIVLTRRENARTRAEFLAGGALAVLNPGLRDELLADTVEALLGRVQPIESLPLPDERVHRPTLEDFRTRSHRMERFLELVRRVADASSSLLIQGETGVGKEWLARAIHGASRRSSDPFVALNCAAFPETLLESELFGHEEGSFTGAVRSRRGHFELAHGGTILLDEVGDMPLHMQAKLLRVLQEREIMPLGSEELIEVDVRVLAATNRDIAGLVQSGRFRSDLHYRLGVITLQVPPLRERREDIPELSQRYASELGVVHRGVPYTVDADAQELLMRQDWPGNVRELVNVIERAVLLGFEPRVSTTSLGLAVATPSPILPSGEEVPLMPSTWNDLKSVRRRAADAAERDHLGHLLQSTGGSVGETARLAGITPRALRNRMRRFGLRKEAFRDGGAANAGTPL